MKYQPTTLDNLRAAYAVIGDVVGVNPGKMFAFNAIWTHGTRRKQRKQLESQS